MDGNGGVGYFEAAAGVIARGTPSRLLVHSVINSGLALLGYLRYQ